MRSTIGAGITAGLAAGVVLGLLLALMQTPLPTGDQPSIMTMVARTIGLRSLVADWLVVIAVSGILGAIFAALLGRRARDHATGAAAGLAFGLLLWIVRQLVVMPTVAGATGSSTTSALDWVPIAIGSLLAHVLFGAVLGGLLPWLLNRR